MRVGIFGGSFDPVHYGHLILAETAREQLGLDRVLLIPAATSPLKLTGPVAPDAHRLEMLRLAIGDAAGLDVSDVELRRGGISYTVDTLAALREEYSGAELFLIAGADQLPELARWKDPRRIAQLATWALVDRAGFEAIDWKYLRPWVSDAELDAAQRSVIQMPAVELSSSDLRRRAAAGKSLRFRTPRAVEQYVLSHQLYRDLLPESSVAPDAVVADRSGPT